MYSDMRISTLLKPAVMMSVAIALGTSCAYAEEDSIATDRPDFVESSDVVGLGRQQIEIGLSLEKDEAAGEKVRTFTTPALLRLGFEKSWEARIETDGLTRARTTDSSGSTTERGASDVAVGVKLHLQDGEGGSPGMALLLHLDFDSGSAAFRGNGLRPSLRAVAEWELSDKTSLGVMPGIVFDRNDQHRFTSGILAATYGVQLTPVVHGFVEIAGQQIAKVKDGGNVITYDTGISCLLGNNTQVDAAISIGANDIAPDWNAGIGFSHRFGK